MEELLKKTIDQYKSTYPNFESDFLEELLRQEISLQLIQMRQGRGLSQSEFAKEIGIKQPQLARLESGSTNPTIQSLQKIAYHAGYTLKLSFEKR